MARSTKKKTSKRIARVQGNVPQRALEWAQDFNDLVIRLHALTLGWEGYYFNAAMRHNGRVDAATAKQALSVARTLRATVAALITDDDLELEKRAKESARYVGERSRGLIKNTGRAMVSLSKYGSEFQVAVHDVVPEKGQLGTRAQAAARLRSTLDWHIAQGTAEAGELANVFLLNLDGPWGLREFFIEHKIDIDSDGSRSKRAACLQKAFARLMLNSRNVAAERLVIVGARALGVKKSAAESLFDFERAKQNREQEKR